MFSSKSWQPWRGGNEMLNYIIQPNIRQESFHKSSYEKWHFPSRFFFLLWARTAPTLVDPADRAILHQPLVEQSCLRGPSELVLCLPEDRGTAGFSNVMLHQKLDNEKSPPPQKKIMSVSHTPLSEPLESWMFCTGTFMHWRMYWGGAIILCSDKYGTCTTSVVNQCQ